MMVFHFFVYTVIQPDNSIVSGSGVIENEYLLDASDVYKRASELVVSKYPPEKGYKRHFVNVHAFAVAGVRADYGTK